MNHAMLDVREKIVELIESARYWGSSTSEEIADYLISNGVTVQEWIDVKDRLPEESGMYIVTAKDGHAHMFAVRAEIEVGFRCDTTVFNKLTRTTS